MKLLVLDIDETLLFATEQILDRAPDFEAGQYLVYKRPGLEEFFKRVNAHFELAVWTSSTEGYAAAVLPEIIPIGITLQFAWSRERCTRRYDPELLDYEWSKDLGKLKRRGYRLEHVLMVDDTPAKLAKHYGNLVRAKPYFGDAHDAELSPLADYLISLAQVPNVRLIEKRFWRSATYVV